MLLGWSLPPDSWTTMDEGMKCIYCQGFIELPDRPHPAWCPKCDKYFHMVEDHDWFGYQIGIYVPLPEKDPPK